MKSAKHKALKKTTRKKRGIYSLPPKKKNNIHFHGVNGEPANSENGVLHEEATAYSTHFTPAPVLEIEMPDVSNTLSIETSEELSRIEKLNSEAETRWADKLCVDSSLTRALVSFQANKGRAVYRWFKYKEAFSAGLIEHLLNKYRISTGILLDPFAESGTA